MNFDSLNEWVQIYRAAGLDDIQVTSGPFEMMTMGGFLTDEGFTNSMFNVKSAFVSAVGGS